MTDIGDYLAAWLGVQFDEDERIAKAADQAYQRRVLAERSGEPVLLWDFSRFASWFGLAGFVARRDELAFHVANYDPARVLAEVKAKRALLAMDHFQDENVSYSSCWTCGPGELPCQTLRWLAWPYADRPGYQERWRPS